MQYNFYLSNEDKERIYHTDLVKYGVKYDKAAKVAKILASNKEEEQWTEEERKLVLEACKQWLDSYNRYKNLQEFFY
ncbi:hypothetical protein [Calothrix sp. NIES-2098]|uniref:hypothetical protein n=1 Tax=Calothrix sp. NIES-2098 TaxID=1954171 RepID=UPI000B5F55E6|nr:hypothetical protein NIES2098_29880 [Calothrix sp. NIES-2098]